MRAITVRHLLTHTSGFTYSIWSEALTRYEQATAMPDIATCKNATFTAPLVALYGAFERELYAGLA